MNDPVLDEILWSKQSEESRLSEQASEFASVVFSKLYRDEDEAEDAPEEGIDPNRNWNNLPYAPDCEEGD